MAALGVLAAGSLGIAAAGCETTVEKAEKVAAQGDAAFRAEGIAVARANREVTIVSQDVVSDANGTAVVAVLRNEGRAPLADVPLALSVRAGRRVVARNDAPGLERGLTHAALLPVGRDALWVHDQVLVTGGRPTAAEVVPGRGRPAPAGAEEVEIAIEGARLVGDPASGITAEARAVERSGIAQDDLVIVCVARRGGRVVAAGRAIVPVLRANGRAPFQVFFIGDPRGAELEFAAQPTRFE